MHLGRRVARMYLVGCLPTFVVGPPGEAGDINDGDRGRVGHDSSFVVSFVHSLSRDLQIQRRVGSISG